VIDQIWDLEVKRSLDVVVGMKKMNDNAELTKVKCKRRKRRRKDLESFE